MDRLPTIRGEDRKDVDLSARCRTFSGLRDQAYVTNISAHGCCLSCKGLLMNVGTRLVIQLAGLEGIAGVVRWISKQQAGIEFDTPLYAPIVEHLTKHHPGRVPMSITHLSD